MLDLFPLENAKLLEVKDGNNNNKNSIKYLLFVRHCTTEFICIILCNALDNSITPVSQMRKQRLKEIKNLSEACQRLKFATQYLFSISSLALQTKFHFGWQCSSIK